jgi:flagellar capping protein FliD
MFGTRIANRTARGMAVGALILSISATTFGGSANAAPLADETQDCSAAAHARNDAVHLLHTAWKAFDGDLKDLAKDARELQHDSNKDKASADLTKDARAEVASAKQDLKSIASQAHADIQDAADLGTACKAEEDSTTTTTTTSTTAPSDATAPADSTEGAHSFDTSGLDSKYKDIVDQAITDMQGVVDDATKAVLDLSTAVETTSTADDTKVKKDLETAKAARETAKADREEAKAAAKDKSTDKSNAKPDNSGKGNSGKGKGRK